MNVEELRAARRNGIRPEAVGADLRNADLRNVNLEGADLRNANLEGADLRYAKLRYANLEGANLRGAKLSHAKLRNANLRGAILRDADLRSANASNADLRDADLWGANLWGASLLWGAMPLQAGKSGSGYLIPTPDGWRISIGCWEDHTLDDLDDLIHDRAVWPEAEGPERDRRRPMLSAVHALCLAHIGQQSETIITDLAERWKQ